MSARVEGWAMGPWAERKRWAWPSAVEPLHTLLPLACRLGRVLRPIVERPVLTMFHSRKNLPLGGSIAREFVGEDHVRDGGQPFEQLATELLCSCLVPPALDQAIQDVALLLAA